MAASGTLGELQQSPDISPLLRRVLAACAPPEGSRHIEIEDFLAAVVKVAPDAGRPNSGLAWKSVADPTAGRLPPRDLGLAGHASLTVSPGLHEAFRAARSLRARTGGRDRFIGLRHVLAAICAPAGSASIEAELQAYLQKLGLRRQAFVQALSRDIFTDPEPQENLEVWRDHFGEAASGLSVTATAITGPTPEQHDHEDLTRSEIPDSDERLPAEAQTVVHAQTGPVGPGQGPVFALAGADDPLAKGLRDRTGALREAEAFAMLATARQFKPPIAFGVFGQWGSGKSFFLRLVREQVARLTAAATPEGPFHGDVVPVVFNAWHYAETNLWASLVDHIFTELDRWSSPAFDPAASLLENLASSRSFTLEAAERLVASRREQHEAAARFEKASNELAIAQSKAGAQIAALAETAWQEVWKAAKDRDKVKKAAKQLGFGEVTDSADDLATALGQLDRELQTAGFVRGPFWRVVTGGAVLSLTALGCLVLPPLLTYLGEKYLPTAALYATALAGLAAPFMAAVAYASRTARTAVTHFEKVRPLLAAARAKAQANTDNALGELQRTLADKTAAAAEAKAVFDSASERLAQASSDYTTGTGRGRLLNFVRERVTAGDYGRQLSFVATIRKDFEALSTLMAGVSLTDSEATEAARRHKEQTKALVDAAGVLLEPAEIERLENTNSPVQGRTFQRIILYIDDLDRCPPAKVVEVLQAIHLLLAFPLFVVFVAVDVRWLQQAVQQEYSGLLESGAPKKQASAFDYLEKIFQVPYWVRPLEARSTADLLMDRITLADEPLPRDSILDTAEHRAEPGAQPPQVEASADVAPPTPADEVAQPMRMSRAEATFIEELAPGLAVSPRRALRFINTYNLIKASLNQDLRAELEDRDYPAVLTLLAVSIAADEAARPIFQRLRRVDIQLNDLVDQTMPAAERALTEHALRVYTSRAGASVEELKRYMSIVERFTFIGFCGAE